MRQQIFYWIYFFVNFHISCEKITTAIQEGFDQRPYAYIINAEAWTFANGTQFKRRLELNFLNMEMDNEVVLYENDEIILRISAMDYPDGFYVTNIELPYISSEDLGYSEHCVFDYFIQIENKGEILVPKRCLKLQPNWMYKRKEILGDQHYNDLFLAFTHDSGAYKQYEGSGDDNLATLAVFAQEESLEQQLQYGVRGLDIRVGYYPTTDEKFWLVHGIIKAHPLTIGLEQIQNFMRNSQDIVYICFWQFEQIWTDEAHSELIEMLENYLGNWWVLPDENQLNRTLNDIWNQPYLPVDEGRLLIAYANYNQNLAPFFHTIRETWGNKVDPMELKEYLDAEVEAAFNNPMIPETIFGCQMTLGGISDLEKWHGLRDMADAVNRNVTKWWITNPIYFSINGAYPMVDFVLSSDLIQWSISKNLLLI